jgi:hypothetical protein
VNIKPKVSYGELQHVKPDWYNQLYIHTRNIPSTQQENTCMITGLGMGVYPQNAQILRPCCTAYGNALISMRLS